MSNIQFTNAARQDLKSIFSYSIRKWGAEKARYYSDQLRTHADKIAQGTAFSKAVPHKHRNLRQTTSGRHLIIFEQNDEQVLLVRILHEAMDIPRHISSLN